MYKISCRYVVDEYDDFVYGLSATLSGNVISVRLIKHKPTTSIIYEIDSHTKYSIAVIADTLMYLNNHHLGWLRCHWMGLEDLPPQKKQVDRKNVGK